MMMNKPVQEVDLLTSDTSEWGGNFYRKPPRYRLQLRLTRAHLCQRTRKGAEISEKYANEYTLGDYICLQFSVFLSHLRRAGEPTAVTKVVSKLASSIMYLKVENDRNEENGRGHLYRAI